MFKNHLTLAVRSLFRHKAYSAINIFGLAVGLAASAIIYNWVRYEYSFDGHHEKADRIYRIIHEIPNEGGSLVSRSGTGGRLAPVLQDQFPEIEEVVRLWPKNVWIQHDGRGYDQVACMADSSLFRVFTIPLVVAKPFVVFSRAGQMLGLPTIHVSCIATLVKRGCQIHLRLPSRRFVMASKNCANVDLIVRLEHLSRWPSCRQLA